MVRDTLLLLDLLTQIPPSGKFVSESKFLEDPAAFIPHIQNPNRKALEDLITKPEVERRLLVRLAKKAATYAQDFAADGSQLPTTDGKANGSSKIDVDGVVNLYESYIIPLTKEVEVSVHSPSVDAILTFRLAGGLLASAAGWSVGTGN